MSRRRKPPPPIDAPGVWPTLMDAFKITKDAAEALEQIPYVKAIAGVLAQVLQMREDVIKNSEKSAALVDDVRNRSRGLINFLARYAQETQHLYGSDLENTLKPLEEGLREYHGILEKIYISLEGIRLSTRGFSGSFNRLFGRDAIKTTLESLHAELAEFDSRFMIQQLSHLRLDVATQISNAKPAVLPVAREPMLMTLPPPSRLFIGRREIRKHMYDAFFREGNSTVASDQKCYVLHGLGGSGKTQLALKFINDNRSRFTRIYIVDASSIEHINTHLEDIGTDGGVSSSPKANDTLRWLSLLKENWLILFDNADDPKIDLHPFFPACTHGNIIITSRNPQCATHACPPHASWKVSDLTLEEAVELLFSASGMTGKDDSEQAALLVRELGLLALAIVQAGSYISKIPGLSFAAYMERYRTNRDWLLRAGPSQRRDSYAHTVYTTWEMSFEKLGPAAKSFLQLSGFLHNEGITRDIFEQAISRVRDFPEWARDSFPVGTKFLEGWVIKNGLFDKISFDAILAELASYSLIQQTTPSALSIHPLVHSWSRDRLDQDDRNLSHRLTLDVLSLSITNELDPINCAHRRLLLPHLDAALPEQLSALDIITAKRFAGAFDLERRCKKMAELYRAVVAQQEGQLDALALGNIQFLAKALSLNGEHGEAEQLRVKLVDDTKRVLGVEHPETLTSMVNLASTYHIQGRHVEAESIQVEVLERRKPVLGSEHPDTLRGMANLASTYRAQCRYRDAELLEKQVLHVRTRILGLEHPDTLHIMANLAGTYHVQGRYGDAESLTKEVLALRKRVLGSEHPDTLFSMAGLALNYHAQGQYGIAEPLEKEVLELRNRVLGLEHPATLWSMASLASTYSDKGRYSIAEPLEVEVLEGRKRVLGLDHPETLMSMANLAETYRAQGRHTEAEPLMVEVFQIQNRVLGSEHPHTLVSSVTLALCYQEQGRYDGAEPICLTGYEGLLGRLGPSHPYTWWSMSVLAELYEKQGRGEKADSLRTSLAALQPTNV